MSKKLVSAAFLLLVLIALSSSAYAKTETYNCKSILENESIVDYCWGFLETHTYDFGEIKDIGSISGWLNAGPSELLQEIPIEIQLSNDNITYTTEDVFLVLADSSTKSYYNLSVQKNARYLRFHALPINKSDTGFVRTFVDGSSLNVETSGFFIKLVKSVGRFFTFKWLVN
jgi:hypothetical protein